MNKLKNIEHHVFTNLGVGVRDDIWLFYRYEIFQNTVFQSIKNQTTQNFIWHIFIDSELTNIIKYKIYNLFKSHKNYRVHEVDDYSEISGHTEKLLSNSSKYLITTRIDDDDLLHTTAIELIQEMACEYIDKFKISIVAFKNGIEYLPGDDLARFSKYESLALGLSLFDFSDDKKISVTDFSHNTIRQTSSEKFKELNFISIEKDFPLFIYTKHPLGDSYYFGFRARIISDTENFKFSEYDLNNLFGFENCNIKNLELIIKSCPLGMPYKHMAKLNEVNYQLRDNANLEDSIKNKLLAKKNYLQTKITRANPSRFKKNKFRVAIFGSTATRDLFLLESDYLNKFEVVFYSARIPICSYVSLPSFDKSIVINGDSYESQMARIDLEKKYWDIYMDSYPDIVFVDSIDERIGCLQFEGSYFSGCGPTLQGFINSGKNFKIFDSWDDESSFLRNYSIDVFLGNLKLVCDNIIFHKAQWATKYISSNGELSDFTDNKNLYLIEKNNFVLLNIFDKVESSRVGVDFIGGVELDMFAGGEHLWSFSPYNYSKTYYYQLSRQFNSRVL
jgi:hypothetical protein